VGEEVGEDQRLVVTADTVVVDVRPEADEEEPVLDGSEVMSPERQNSGLIDRIRISRPRSGPKGSPRMSPVSGMMVEALIPPLQGSCGPDGLTHRPGFFFCRCAAYMRAV
jgi:hypothetical protein